MGNALQENVGIHGFRYVELQEIIEMLPSFFKKNFFNQSIDRFYYTTVTTPWHMAFFELYFKAEF
jgi:hypothetical protein